MANPRQRIKNRNPSRKVKQKTKNPLKISFQKTHPLLMKNWDHKKTLEQNYENLGLVSNLGGKAGGCGNEYEIRVRESERLRSLNEIEFTTLQDFDSIVPTIDTRIETIEGALNLDPKTLRIGTKINHKHAPESDITTEPTDLKLEIQQLLKQQELNFEKKIVNSSRNEELVLQDLISKYGQDYSKMSRDLKLNRYQFSEGQLKRKIQKLTNKA